MVVFSKILSETDIRRRCAVPMKYFEMEGFPRPRRSPEGNHSKDFVVKDEEGHDWILCCSIRNIGDDPDRPKHEKPVLIKQWIPFVRSKALRVGDRVIIYEEEDETCYMQRRIKVEKRTCPCEARSPPFTEQNSDGNKGSSSTSINSANESTVSRINATTTPCIDKEHVPTTRSTFQDTTTRHKTKRPRLSLSLEFTMEPKTRGTTSTTSSGIDKRTLTFHSQSQDIGCNSSETPSLSLNLGLSHRPAYMQETKPRTIDFLGGFL